MTPRLRSGEGRRIAESAGAGGKAISGRPSTLIVIYSYGDFVAATKVVRSDDKTAKPIEIEREDSLPASKVDAFFKNPFANLAAAKAAPLKIENALITPVPSARNGWLTAFFIFCFMAFFAVGPGVCVWLALSELMPTRIRSNGMSIALLINQAVSTTIAAIFLPTVGKYGYGTMFFAFAARTVIYFITATFFLPETKGKTLEEIEEHFSGQKRCSENEKRRPAAFNKRRDATSAQLHNIGPLGNHGDRRLRPVPLQGGGDGRLDARRRIDVHPPQDVGRKTVADHADTGMPVHADELFQLPLVGLEILAAGDLLHEAIQRGMVVVKLLEVAAADALAQGRGEDDRSARLDDRHRRHHALHGLVEGRVQRVAGRTGDHDVDRLRHGVGHQAAGTGHALRGTPPPCRRPRRKAPGGNRRSPR